MKTPTLTNTKMNSLLNSGEAKYVDFSKLPKDKFFSKNEKNLLAIKKETYVVTKSGQLFKSNGIDSFHKIELQLLDHSRAPFFYICTSGTYIRIKAAQLIASNLIENRNNYSNIFFKDYDCLNLNISNLEWAKHNQKRETRERTAKMLEMNQAGMTLQAIGDEFSLSRERVRQIIEDQYQVDVASVAKRKNWIGHLARRVIELEQKINDK